MVLQLISTLQSEVMPNSGAVLSSVEANIPPPCIFCMDRAWTSLNMNIWKYASPCYKDVEVCWPLLSLGIKNRPIR